VFLSNMLGLARDISLPVIAEGVERVAQLTELERLGCPMAQGYIVGRPAPAADLTLTVEPPSRPRRGADAARVRCAWPTGTGPTVSCDARAGPAAAGCGPAPRPRRAP